MKKALLLVPLLIMCSACVRQNEYVPFNHFAAKTYINFITSFETNILAADVANTAKAIDSPPMIWIPLVQSKVLKGNAESARSLCLFYRVPYPEKKSQGTLRLTEIDLNETCTDPESGEILSETTHIIDLYFYLSYERKNIDDGKHVLKPFTLGLKALIQGEDKEAHEEWSEFPLANLTRMSLLREGVVWSPLARYRLERYRPSIMERQSPGITIWPLASGSMEKRKVSDKQFKMLGEWENSYEDRTLIKCYDVDAKCNVKLINQCDRCRYGWFEVVGEAQCPGGGPKFCGVDRCGEKGWPACPRGILHSEEEKDALCATESDAGFCHEDLKTTCDENKILTCL